MARRSHRLTVAHVRNAKAGMHPDGHGLYLQVTDSGARSWLFRYSVGKRERYAGLGPCHAVSLADARHEAQRCRQMRLQGIDPIEARRAARATNALASSGTTFREFAEQLISAKAEGFRNLVVAAQWRQSLADYAYPKLGKLPPAGVTTKHVLECLEPIWTKKPEMAKRVRSRIEAVLDAYRARNPDLNLPANPARWKGHLSHLLPDQPKGTNHAALPYGEVGAFMAALRKRGDYLADLFEIAILTAARPGEAIHMRVHEVNFDKALWTIPKGRMKMDREHIVPLPERALTLIRKHVYGKAVDAVVFTGPKGRATSNKTLGRVHRALGYNSITTHGFRSSFRDWAGDQTAFDREAIEFCLAHVKGDAAEKAYRRTSAIEKRRVIMEAWADYCDQITPTTRDVIPIRRGKSR